MVSALIRKPDQIENHGYFIIRNTYSLILTITKIEKESDCLRSKITF